MSDLFLLYTRIIVILSDKHLLSLPAVTPSRVQTTVWLGYFSAIRQSAESENTYVSDNIIVLQNKQNIPHNHSAIVDLVSKECDRHFTEDNFLPLTD